MLASLAPAVSRLVKLVLVLFLVSVLAFMLLELTPGDPLTTLLPEGATPEQIAQVRAAYGLDKPVMERYLDWAGGALHGDLGRSLQSGLPVTEAIFQRLPVTLELTIVSLVLSLVVAVPLGVYSGYRPGGVVDRVATFLSSLSLSIPNFLMGVLLVFVLGVTLDLLPPTGWVPFERDPVRHIEHLVLPVLTLAAAETVLFLRLLRSDMVATLQQDFALSARARGLPTWRILFGHALRPSSFSLLTVFGVTLGRLLGGTVIVESLFSLPGLGSLVINAISNRDYLMIQGIVLFVAVAYVLINTIVDLSYPLLDPRVRRA